MPVQSYEDCGPRLDHVALHIPPNRLLLLLQEGGDPSSRLSIPRAGEESGIVALL